MRSSWVITTAAVPRPLSSDRMSSVTCSPRWVSRALVDFARMMWEPGGYGHDTNPSTRVRTPEVRCNVADQTVSRGTIGSPRAVYRTHVQLAALTVGIVFLVVGIAGFIPGITTNYDEMEFAGHESMAELFGVFKVSILHNIVHILFGVAGIAAARTWT